MVFRVGVSIASVEAHSDRREAEGDGDPTTRGAAARVVACVVRVEGAAEERRVAQRRDACGQG